MASIGPRSRYFCIVSVLTWWRVSTVKLSGIFVPILQDQRPIRILPKNTVKKLTSSKVRIQGRTLLPVVVLVLSFAIVACTSDTATFPAAPSAPELSIDGPESRAAEALALVPLEFSSEVIVFADYYASRIVNGLEEIDSTEELFQSDSRGWERLYGGVPLHPHLSTRVQTMIDLLGVDVVAFDLSTWSWQFGNRKPTFLLAEGAFDRENVAGGLRALDYKEGDYAGTVYYWLNEDFAPSLTHHLGLPLNRVALLNDQIVAAPSTGILEQLIDANHGASPNLLESEPHRTLVHAIGEGLVGGAFMPPRWIVENWNTANTRSASRLDRYIDGSQQWGQLSTYDLALFGYRVQGDAEETLIALYYPDPALAARDSVELEKRWNSFYYDPKGPVGDPKEVPATLSCSPFSTTTIEGTDHSVLVGTCPVLRTEEWNVEVKGPSLWTWLFSTRELQFLARDLKELQ